MTRGWRAVLLRQPTGAGEVAADVVRLLTVAGIPIAAFGGSGSDAAMVALGSLATVLPRLLHLRAGIDLAFAVTATVATWSAVTELYVAVPWWDLPIHFAFAGLLALCATAVLTRAGALPDTDVAPRPRVARVVVVGALGVALGVVWELVEWFAKVFLDPATYVGYQDTLGDLAIGGLGAALAGLLPRNRVESPRARG